MVAKRSAIGDELSRLEEDLLYTEKAHFESAEVWGRVHLWLGLVVTVASGLAAATIIKQTAPVVPGVLALISTVGGALITFVKPDETAQTHLGCGRAMGALRVRVRQVRLIELANVRPEEVLTLYQDVRSLSEEKAEVDSAAPHLPNWAFKRAQRKIQAGHFTHDPTARA